MVWINSEYSEEFAVLSAWLSLLLPWSVAYGQVSLVGDSAKETSIVILRFPLFGIRYVLGSGFIDGTTLKTPYGFFSETSGAFPAQAAAHLVWVVAAVLVLVLFAVSLAMYFEVPAVQRLPGNGVYVVGTLLVVLAVAYAVAAFRLDATQGTKILGLPQFVPVGLLGTVLVLVLGVINLFAERT
ncbi:DUF7549 family protein [Haloarchaeobius sp. TZWWS8]|uniref:DUF7549 family protein n=1 Tax=Haloarchaeobius sp. TZWWS8 TaxID=3446121 RepID=UPI003EBE899E